MLKSLHIENIALIEQCDIDFETGFNVLTGETGAGKSIIIDSISALIGGRVSKDLVRFGANHAIVSAVFEDVGCDVSKWLCENDYISEDDEIEELIVTRKISSDGKSSCRICGIPSSVSQLKELGGYLIDIHGQNDGRQLLDESKHLYYLDLFAGNAEKVSQYTDSYKKYKSLVAEKARLSASLDEKEYMTQMLTSRVNELEQANLTEGEEEELTARRSLLKNSEKLTEQINAAVSSLDDEQGALNTLSQAVYFTDRAANIAPELSEASKSLNNAIFEAKNAFEILTDFLSSMDFSPDEYDKLEKRLHLINQLQRKYKTDESGLIELLNQSKEKLYTIESSDDRLNVLDYEIENAKKETLKRGRELSNCRREAAEILSQRVEKELNDLNMKGVKFVTEFEPLSNPEGFGSEGIENVAFLMSANAGESLGKINKIASGGELSRIMLSLKNVFASVDVVSTLIFDEVDTGVSGRAAQRIAEKLYQVSKDKQVMCVTHLPQIAAMADRQLLVEKSTKDGRTFTDIKKLDDEGRKNVLATLYGGDNITQASILTAEAQLKAAETFKNSI